MATRFYLPASGTAPLGSLAVDSQWELTTGLQRLPCYTTKQNTALANTVTTWPAEITQQWCWFQYQSQYLQAAYDWTTSDTVSMVIRVLQAATQTDTHLCYVIRVVSADGSTIRGTIGSYLTTSTEYATSAATRIHSARTNGATNFSSQIGDRIIIEIGVHGVTPSATSVTHRVGDPSGTADFALTEGLTTDLCPWVELSKTVSLGSGLSTTVTPSSLASKDTIVTPTIKYGYKVVVAAVAALFSLVANNVYTDIHNNVGALHSQFVLNEPTVSLTTGTVVSVSAISGKFTIIEPTIIANRNIIVTQTALSAAFNIPVPTVTGKAIIEINSFVGTFSLPPPTIITAGEVIVTPDAVSGHFNLNAQNIYTDIHNNVGSISALFYLGTPTIIAGGAEEVTVTPSSVTGKFNLVASECDTDITLVPDTISSKITVGSPTISTELNTAVSVSSVSGKFTLATPNIIGNVTISVSSLEGKFSVVEPAVIKTNIFIVPASLSGNFIVGAPSIYCNVLVDIAALNANFLLPSPTVLLGGEALFEAGPVYGGFSLPLPSIITDVFLAPDSIAGKFYLPTPHVGVNITAIVSSVNGKFGIPSHSVISNNTIAIISIGGKFELVPPTILSGGVISPNAVGGKFTIVAPSIWVNLEPAIQHFDTTIADHVDLETTIADHADLETTIADHIILYTHRID